MEIFKLKQHEYARILSPYLHAPIIAVRADADKGVWPNIRVTYNTFPITLFTQSTYGCGRKVGLIEESLHLNGSILVSLSYLFPVVSDIELQIQYEMR